MYEILSQIAQTWGLMLFVVLFGGALIYALWPKNQDRFDRAAAMPLDDADTPETEDGSHV